MYTARNATTTRTAVSAATPTTIKADNAGLRGWVLFNDTASDLYVLAGSGTPSTTNFTWKVPAAQHLQEPASDAIYIGPLQVYSTPGGNVNLTLFTI